MEISKVEYASKIDTNYWFNLKFNVTRPNPNLGNAVEVYLKDKHDKGSKFYLRFYYRTNENTTSTSWLTPE